LPGVKDLHRQGLSKVGISFRVRTGATVRPLNEVLSRHRYNHSENYITSDHEGGWYVKTEIITHREADPEEILRILKDNDQVLDAEIK
ncbi:MAG: hypothetical protein IJJ24_10865, partial [Solobacterium sp.]|nr:hypothetical protein [Solobacterium sp.]